MATDNASENKDVVEIIEPGDRVKDIITGFSGIALGVTYWLYGCRRIIVQPEQLTPEGRIGDAVSFDEPQLALLQKRVVTRDSARDGENPGGPRPEPARRQDVTR